MATSTLAPGLARKVKKVRACVRCVERPPPYLIFRVRVDSLRGTVNIEFLLCGTGCVRWPVCLVPPLCW